MPADPNGALGHWLSALVNRSFRKAKMLRGEQPDEPRFVPFGLEVVPPNEPFESDILGIFYPSPTEAASARSLAEALPDADDLPAGTYVVVPDHARQGEGFLAKVLPRRRIAPEHACAAFLARGYVGIARGTCPRGSGMLVVARVRSSQEGVSRRE